LTIAVRMAYLDEDSGWCLERLHEDIRVNRRTVMLGPWLILLLGSLLETCYLLEKILPGPKE
jgi:hypothetical protein